MILTYLLFLAYLLCTRLMRFSFIFELAVLVCKANVINESSPLPKATITL
ncbi:hypothetical protein [Clostera anachoreta granulovirus]|uniref:Uncharacterized protein n=1 Tax=Clostera anachoreta granulovirus TaxID=283675 RepID=F4ZKX6_9BBAC|nr:hypothetical protein ClanGV_gp099 [Clostera anachoreta granulovirus]AEB00387.1 hypothetical protein [Clostera anachoreta granulovirus]